MKDKGQCGFCDHDASDHELYMFTGMVKGRMVLIEVCMDCLVDNELIDLPDKKQDSEIDRRCELEDRD